MSITPNLITKKTKKAKKTVKKREQTYGQYFSYKDFDFRVTTISFLENFAKNMINYALNTEDCLTVEDLFLSEGIPSGTYYDWIKKHEFFARAHKHAKEIIGRRREKGGLKRKFDTSLVKDSMYQYNSRWKKADEYRQSLKSKNTDSSDKNITVVIEESPRSNLVPERTPEQVAGKIRRATETDYNLRRK